MNINVNFKKTCTISILLSFLMSSCVTTHYGDPTENATSKFSISCGKNNDISHPYISVISCSFENTSSSWIEFNISSVTTKPNEATAKILTPSEIKIFYDAYAYKAERDGHNNALLLSGLIIVGSAAALFSGNRSLASAGATTAVGAIGYSAAKEVSEDVAQHQYSHIDYSEEHMLGGSFTIPAELFIRKHIVIEATHPNDYPSNLEICFSSPQKECLTVPIITSENYRQRVTDQ